jgi:NTP pyrophosphatase (non-canonical NTP hydrolase)
MTTDSFSAYQNASRATAFFKTNGRRETLAYIALGITGESGEIAEKIKQHLRGDVAANPDDPAWRDLLQKEIGDVLWYLARLCDALDLDLGTVAAANLDKLRDRKDRNALQGDGDTR